MKNMLFVFAALGAALILLGTNPVHSMAPQGSGSVIGGRLSSGAAKWSPVAVSWDNVRGLKVEVSESAREYAVVFTANSPFPQKSADMTQPAMPAHCLVRHSGFGFVTDYPATKVNNRWIAVVPKSAAVLLPGQAIHFGVWTAGANTANPDAAVLWRRVDI